MSPGYGDGCQPFRRLRLSTPHARIATSANAGATKQTIGTRKSTIGSSPARNPCRRAKTIAIGRLTTHTIAAQMAAGTD